MSMIFANQNNTSPALYRGRTCTIEDIPNTDNVLKKRWLRPYDNAQTAAIISHQFYSEKRILEGLMDHPNIVTIIDSGHSRVILKKASHGNLSDFLEQHGTQISPDQRFKWCQQLVSAVEYIHKKGIIHAELLAENILVNQDADGELSLWVTDFGKSVWLTERLIADKPAFPIARTRVPGGRSLKGDLFNLGTIIHFVITNTRPHSQLAEAEKIATQGRREIYEEDLQCIYPLDEFKLAYMEDTTVGNLCARRAMIRCLASSAATATDVVKAMALPGAR